MKTVCIYHSRDLDGWMSAAIVKLMFNIKHKQEVIFIGWDYGQDYPDLSSKEMEVIMVDVSFPIRRMGYLAENNNFIWIDHHISAIKAVSEMESLPFIKGLRNDKYAACELTWKFFFPDEPMPEIVRLLGRYDCFGHKGTDEERKVLIFQYAARAFLYDVYTCYNALCSVKTEDIDSWLDTGEAIYTYLCMEAKQLYAQVFTIYLDGCRFACVNQARFNPVNFGINYHTDGYDGFACFWYENGKFSYSLYNDNGKVDCSEIAKQRGGGGHKGASGFRSDVILK